MNNAQSVYGVDWSHRYGAACPQCGVYTKMSYKHSPWRSGYKVRYHVCPDPRCRCKFKSVAVDEAGRKMDPNPEQLRFLRGQGGKQAGATV